MSRSVKFSPPMGVLILAASLLFPTAPDAGVWRFHCDSDGRPSEDETVGPVVVEWTGSAVLFRFHGVDVSEAKVRTTDKDGKKSIRPMTRSGDEWTCEMNLGDGEYLFRVLYRTGGGEKDGSPEDRFNETDHYGLDVFDNGVRLEPDPLNNELSTHLGFDYNRVEGADLSYTLGYRQRRDRVPRFEWMQGYSFGPERWTWKADARLPVWARGGLSIGAEGYDETRDDDRWTVSANENLAAALLIKEDFRDYTWRRGWRVFLDWEKGIHRATIGYREEDAQPLRTTVDWSLFGGAKEFRENLFADSLLVAGGTRSVEGSLEIDTRNRKTRPTTGYLARLDAEYAGRNLGGDYDYARYTAEVSRYMKLARDMHLDFRLIAGAIDGEAPLYRRFYIGGVGTMPAYRFKEFHGDRVLLANIEYRVDVGGDMAVAFFADTGDAWRRSDRRDADLSSDMGIGLESLDGFARLNLAHGIGDGGKNDAVITFRFNRLF